MLRKEAEEILVVAQQGLVEGTDRFVLAGELLRERVDRIAVIVALETCPVAVGTGVGMRGLECEGEGGVSPLAGPLRFTIRLMSRAACSSISRYRMQ